VGVIVVGAGLAGLRTAEALRKGGFEVAVFGDESHYPYNRPPLSKEALKGGIDPDALLFRRKAADIDWHLGSAVTGCDLDARVIRTGAGDHAFDGLVIATGIRSRHLDVPGPQPLTLRTIEDAESLRRHLSPGTRLLIIGAGFIGCEVAATARQLGCDVTIAAYDAEPMLRPLGTDLATAMRHHHEQHGVRFHLGVGVTEFHTDGATLSDGTRLVADVVLEAVGSVANTDWLSGTSLDITDGVLTDNLLRAVGTQTPVVAAGDIARFPNPLFDDVPRRIEHWNMPTETGKRAAATLSTLLAGAAPEGDFRPMPSFWSDQYDYSLQSYGQPALGDAHLVEGRIDGDCIVEYRRDTELLGVVGVNRTRELTRYRDLIGTVA
jgi:3-phenylpropionate/trans-cinnamate dioxygenase ferredoxin reductase component